MAHKVTAEIKREKKKHIRVYGSITNGVNFHVTQLTTSF